MITEETNFNIPSDQRNELNKIGSEIAYNFINLSEKRVFELIAKAWYQGYSHGTWNERMKKYQPYPKDKLVHLSEHANFEKFISYEDHEIINKGYNVKYYSIPETNPKFMIKEVINPGDEHSKLTLVMSGPTIVEGGIMITEIAKVNLADINNIKHILR